MLTTLLRVLSAAVHSQGRTHSLPAEFTKAVCKEMWTVGGGELAVTGATTAVGKKEAVEFTQQDEMVDAFGAMSAWGMADFVMRNGHLPDLARDKGGFDQAVHRT